jgi:AcrR family transcriptional regulator
MPRTTSTKKLPEPAAVPRPSLMDDSPRGRVLRAAAHLFLTRGYAQTTVRDIARAVGILSGSLFHHFDSKEALLEAVMAEVSELNTERMRLAAAASKKPLERVRALVRCELESIHGETSEAMTLLVDEWRSLGPDAQARVLVVRDRYQKVWDDALRAAAAELVAVDVPVLRRLIAGMTTGTATWYRPKGPISLDALTDHVMALITRRKARRG